MFNLFKNYGRITNPDSKTERIANPFRRGKSGPTDVIGNKVYEVNLKFLNNIATFASDLSEGVYIITVKDINGNTYKPQKITVIK